MATEQFDRAVATRLKAESQPLALQWLGRLKDVVLVEPQDIFPTADLLDHIPQLIQQIAEYVGAPEIEELAANSGVSPGPRVGPAPPCTTGVQCISLLREYHPARRDPETFVRDETVHRLTPPALEVFQVASRIPAPARAAADDDRRLHLGVHRSHRGAARPARELQPAGQPRASPAARHAEFSLRLLRSPGGRGIRETRAACWRLGRRRRIG